MLSQLVAAAGTLGAELLTGEDFRNVALRGLAQVTNWRDPLPVKGTGIFLLAQGEPVTAEDLALIARAYAADYAGMAFRVTSGSDVFSLLGTQVTGLSFPVLLLPVHLTVWDFQNWVYNTFPELLGGSLLEPARLVTSGQWLEEALMY